MQNIINRLIKFRDDRDWQKYHTPEALARAISIEAGELNELFLWNREASRLEIADEVSDVMIYCLNLCITKGINPIKAINHKIDVNEEKYKRIKHE